MTTDQPQQAPSYDDAVALLREVGDVELAVTLLLFSRAYERVTGERCAAAEVAAERLKQRKAP